MTKRVFNFSAGPAVLPVSVLEEAQRDLVAMPEHGMSVLEMSHRSKAFIAIMEQTFGVGFFFCMAGRGSSFRWFR